MEEKKMLNEEEQEKVNGGVVDMDTGIYVWYTVQQNDLLSIIAQTYGCTTRILYTLNQNVIGPHPNMLQPGMVLRIPVKN